MESTKNQENLPQELQTVAIVTDINQIYQDVNGSNKAVHNVRFAHLNKRFMDTYGEKPKFFCRAPGRVNIIGEHIDYCGYSVLPAALDQDFIMAYTFAEEDTITINNIDKDSFPSEVISTDPMQKFREDAHWLNYFLCGYKAILGFNSPVKDKVTQPKGLKILIESLVPPAAGLSSSSAFTVCAAVTTMHANNLVNEIGQAKLAELTIAAERLAGTACGGMDQTISIMGKMNTAKLIDFVPALKASDVQVPESVSLVIANSLTPSPKLLTLGTRYNKRVVECQFALGIMSLKLKQCDDFLDCPFKTFYELQQALGADFKQMLKHVQDILKPGGYTIDNLKIASQSDDPFDFVSTIPHINQVEQQNTHYYLFERAYHVFGEAKRVHDFAAVCGPDSEMTEEDKVKRLGELMNASHKSCNELYDCSSPELNELTQMCRDAGALGSRLTGAGWGGCCVSMVKKDQVDDFIEKVMDYYTKDREPGQKLWVTDDLKRYIFGTSLGQGALVLNPDYCDFYQ